MKTVLLVEDNEDDIFMHKTACQRASVPHSLKIVTDGQEAIDYLAGEGKYSDRSRHPLPDLVFLDIQLPKRNGHEVLQWARAQASLKILPIVMLTTSDDPRDIECAYQLGATSYSIKQANLVQFGRCLGIILQYWFEMTIMPH